jgi:hypothetical protein
MAEELPHWSSTEWDDEREEWYSWCRCGWVSNGSQLTHRQATGYARQHRADTQAEVDVYVTENPR